MAFSDFARVNQWIREHPMGKITESLSRLASLEGQVMPIMQGLASSYARSYALVQRLQYDKEGNVSDVTSEEQLTVPASVLAQAYSNVARLKQIRDTIPEIELDEISITANLNSIEFFDTKGDLVLTIDREGKVTMPLGIIISNEGEIDHPAIIRDYPNAVTGGQMSTKPWVGWAINCQINGRTFEVMLGFKTLGYTKPYLAINGKVMGRNPETGELVELHDQFPIYQIQLASYYDGVGWGVTGEFIAGQTLPHVYYNFTQVADLNVWDALINSMNYIDSALPILEELLSD